MKYKKPKIFILESNIKQIIRDNPSKSDYKMDNIIEKIKKIVKIEFDKADIKFHKEPYYYIYHILPAYNISIGLAKRYNANKEIVAISILLHDIGLINLDKGKEHDEAGVKKSKKILKDIGLNDKKIKEILHCIRYHDARDKNPLSIEGKIVCTADALSHIVTPWYIIKGRNSRKNNKDIIKWLSKKLNKDFNRIQFEEIKEEINPIYKNWKIILNGNN